MNLYSNVSQRRNLKLSFLTIVYVRQQRCIYSEVVHASDEAAAALNENCLEMWDMQRITKSFNFRDQGLQSKNLRVVISNEIANSKLLEVVKTILHYFILVTNCNIATLIVKFFFINSFNTTF